MPRVWITEYRGLGADGQGSSIPLPGEPCHTQTVDFGSGSLSAPFRAETRIVRLVSFVDCFMEFGEDPRASSDSEPLLARQEAFRRVRGGMRVSISDGTV